MGQITETIVEFALGDALAQPPSAALATAADGFTDAVGVMLAAVAEPLTDNLRRHVDAQGGRSVSRVMLSESRATVSQATLVGVGAAHALDFDDYAYSNHVSALLVPALLAEADRTPATGAELLRAYLAGMESWGAVMKREPDHLHSKGWHPTGVFGPIGVAIAVGRLRKLSAAQLTYAIGLAACSGGGVMDNFGAQSKSYQGARAAEAGVTAVELALAGLDAGPHALDGSGGLLAALSPEGRVDLTGPIDWLGRTWIAEKEKLNIKRHPTVGASQRAIDAALQVQKDHQPELAEIARVEARISEKHAAVMRFHTPVDALQAKFSLQFGVAAALINGRVGLAELRDEYVSREDVQALLRKVELVIGPDDDPTYPVGAVADSIAVTLRDGRVIESEPVRRFRGHGMNPMTRDELAEKFVECVRPVLDNEAGSGLFEQLQNLNDLQSVNELPVIDLPGLA
ncbi:MAG: MmgE/PrpD family protein [Lysobacterales bacterium]